MTALRIPTYQELEDWLADAVADNEDALAGLAACRLLALIRPKPEEAAATVAEGDLDALVRLAWRKGWERG